MVASEAFSTSSEFIIVEVVTPRKSHLIYQIALVLKDLKCTSHLVSVTTTSPL